MADPQVLTTLRAKRDEIEAVILKLEDKLKEARTDLSHVNATLRLFEVGDVPTQFPVYMNLHRMFRRTEMVAICKDALIEAGEPMTTRELALAVIRAKGWDEEDKVLRQSVAHRIVNALTQAAKRGTLVADGKRGGVRAWRVAP